MAKRTSVAVYLETFVTFEILAKTAIENKLKLCEYINNIRRKMHGRNIR